MYSFENIKLKLDNIGIMHRMIASNKEQLGGKGDKGTTIYCPKGKPYILFATEEDYQDIKNYSWKDGEVEIIDVHKKNKNECQEILNGSNKNGMVILLSGNWKIFSDSPKYQPHIIYIYSDKIIDIVLSVLSEKEKYKIKEYSSKAAKNIISQGKYNMINKQKRKDLNMILYGPPGTGKTYNSVIYAVAICEEKSVQEIANEAYKDIKIRYDKLKSAGRISFTTFHQSYGYEEFIEGIKPIIDENKQDIGYTIEPGVFKKFCDNAKSITRTSTGIESTVIEENTEPYVFIIDEINRGNISKIFGELITLIESTKRAGMPEAASAILPYSGDEFSVPSNVYILGTMNTADRSIALMDTALRRRFQFVEMMPDSDVLRKIHADKVEDLDVAAMLDKINERIEYLYDREHTIGHAFFTDLKDDATLVKLQSIFEKSVIPLLQEYFYEDYQKIQLVLGDNAKSDDSLKFIIDEKVIAKNIFKGNVEDVIDLPEKKYSINSKAFENINSYKEIL
ncbi:MAG: McrB family protein [Lachnospira pectinoschiza]|nr:dynein-related subfamily AAA family protein [Bacteroides galacturonicus]